MFIILAIVLAVLAAIIWAISHLPPWWNPGHALGACTGLSHAQMINCKSYNLYSGSLSDVSELALIVSIVSAMVGLYLHHQCEKPGCKKVGHRHPDHGRPVCRDHYHHDDVAPEATE